MTPQLQIQILKRIEETCGGAARDLRVQSAGDNQCTILCKVRNKTEGQEIGRKIMNLPELAPYKVDLQVQVQP